MRRYDQQQSVVGQWCCLRLVSGVCSWSAVLSVVGQQVVSSWSAEGMLWSAVEKLPFVVKGFILQLLRRSESHLRATCLN